jgi:hypothetical protein
MPNAQEHLNQVTKGVSYLNISDRDLSGVMDLGEFKNLKSLTSSNNKFTNLNFLNSLPNKNKLENINFFGNEISEVDFAFLFTNFPNLKTINLSNNPLAGRSLERLDRQQFSQFVQLVRTGKIKISSLKGTFLVDLLEYTERLFTSSQSRQISSTDHFYSEPNEPKTSNFFSLIGLTFWLFFLWLVFSCFIKHKGNKIEVKIFEG